MSDIVSRSLGAFAVLMALAAPGVHARRGHFPRMIRVEVRDGFAQAFHRETGDLIATSPDLKDYKTRGRIVVFRDASNYAVAYNADGARLAGFRNTTDYRVSPQIVVLRDASGFAAAINHENQELARWSNTVEYAVNAHMVVLKDRSQAAIAVNAEAEVLARWSRTTDFKLSRNIVVLRDDSRQAVAKTHTNELLANWRNTQDYKVSKHVVALRDDSLETIAKSDQNTLLANWKNTTKYLITSSYAVALDRSGQLVIANEDGPLGRRGVADIAYEDEELTITFTNGRTEQMTLWDDDSDCGSPSIKSRGVTFNNQARQDFLAAGGDQLGSAALRTNDLATVRFHAVFSGGEPQ